MITMADMRSRPNTRDHGGYSGAISIGRVRMYTASTFAMVVLMLSSWTAYALQQGSVSPGSIAFSILVPFVGALGTVYVWQSLVGKNLSDIYVWGWLLLVVCTLGTFIYPLDDRSTLSETESRLLLAFIGVAALILASIRPLRWTLAFGLVISFSSLAFLDLDLLSLIGIIILGYLTGAFSIWVYRVVEELHISRIELATLHVAEERLRFSREVHDVVGRALSAISLKCQLAIGLAQRQDARAIAEMKSVSDIAHQTMVETRDIAKGYSKTDLVREIQGAESLLGHAGIAVETRTDASRIPKELREPMAWVVREGVTNILKHSTAKSVLVEAGERSIRLSNDGSNGIMKSDGTGLESLSQRLREQAGTLRSWREDDNFVLEARFE